MYQIEGLTGKVFETFNVMDLRRGFLGNLVDTCKETTYNLEELATRGAETIMFLKNIDATSMFSMKM